MLYCLLLIQIKTEFVLDLWNGEEREGGYETEKGEEGGREGEPKREVRGK